MFLLKSDVFLIGFSMFLVTIKCLLFTSIERNLELKVCISYWKWTFETFIDLVLGKKNDELGSRSMSPSHAGLVWFRIRDQDELWHLPAIAKLLLTLHLLALGSFRQTVAYTVDMSCSLLRCLGYLGQRHGDRNNTSVSHELQTKSEVTRSRQRDSQMSCEQ